MLPDNFDFALIPRDVTDASLKEIGMLASTIEDIDRSLTDWIKDLELRATTNEGWKKVPVLWQTPERAYQIKNEKQLRDDGGTLKFPLLSVERTGIIKDPERKGGFQAQLYSNAKNGRTGRVIIAKQIVPDKTRNFAVAAGTRTNSGGKLQQHFDQATNDLRGIKTSTEKIWRRGQRMDDFQLEDSENNTSVADISFESDKKKVVEEIPQLKFEKNK